MEGVKISRHCAFCLIPLAAKDVKNCAKCLRRAYCGKECQTKDWKSKKDPSASVAEIFDADPEAAKVGGQGHKNWCGKVTCEEDLDWVVKEGGRGVVAKRLIRQGEVIFVGFGPQFRNRSGAAGGGNYTLFNFPSSNARDNSIYKKSLPYHVVIITARKNIKPGAEIICETDTTTKPECIEEDGKFFMMWS